MKRKPGIENVLLNVTALAPTFFELTGVQCPETYNNKKVYQLPGESFLSYLEGKKNTVHKSDYVFALEHYGACMPIKGNWKITIPVILLMNPHLLCTIFQKTREKQQTFQKNMPTNTKNC